MQFSFLPTAAHHWRFTPEILSPFLTSLVSSRMPVAWGPLLIAADLLELVERPILAPVVLTEEFLQGPYRHTGVDGDRFDAHLGNVRELARDVDLMVTLRRVS